MTVDQPSSVALESTKPKPEEVSELSAPLSDVEPETTATAAALKSKNAALGQSKRSYKTVDQAKRKQLVSLVNQDQMTIKEAANRLNINYSTAKHIIKSQKSSSVLAAQSRPATATFTQT